MAKTYNGRFEMPQKPDGGTLWLVLGIGLMIFGNIPGIVLGILSLNKYDKCKKEVKLHERFLKYCAVIGMRGKIGIRELAKAADRAKVDVRKDLQSMIAKGYFGDHAYLDVDGGWLVLTDGYAEPAQGDWKDAVMNLLHNLRGEFDTDASAAETKYEEPEPAQKTEEAPKRSPAVQTKQTYMDELERTLNELYRLNVQIEDEGVSRRIDRIGELTGGIFRAVIENPEREGDVRKFMNYYLPTTLKLLKSYDLMESQSYQGENIVSSRKKIEEVLDMLIGAYEKQLDRLFTNDALDIATDIDVLETMMAGDGLSSKGRIQI